MFEVSLLAGCPLLVRPNPLAAFRASEVNGGPAPTDLKCSLDVDLLATVQDARRRLWHLFNTLRVKLLPCGGALACIWAESRYLLEPPRWPPTTSPACHYFLEHEDKRSCTHTWVSISAG